MTRTAIARLFRFVREKTGKNDGYWVEVFLRYVGANKGDPWCAAFVSWVLGIEFEEKSPIPKTASCEVLHQFGKTHQLLVSEPQDGDIFLILIGKNDKGTPEDHAHHTGFCTSTKNAGGVFHTIEGNTNPAGGRDGYGVFERERVAGPHIIFLRPRKA